MATSPRSLLILALVGLFLFAPLAAVGVLVPGAAEKASSATAQAPPDLADPESGLQETAEKSVIAHEVPPPQTVPLQRVNVTLSEAAKLSSAGLAVADMEMRTDGIVVLTATQTYAFEALADSDVPSSPTPAVVQESAPAAESPPDSSEPTETSQTMFLLIAASQNSLALFGLAQHPGLGQGFTDPYASLSLHLSSVADRGVQAETVLASPAHGWILQAMWTVTLAAVGWALARAVGAPAFATLLFSRFNRDDVLDNDRRSQLYEAVRANPGIPFGTLCGRLGLAHGVVQHHLRLLEQHELVRRLRDGRTTRFYPKGPKFEPPAALAPARREILNTLAREPGLTTPELATRLGQRVQSTWEHVQRLRGAGLVSHQRRGKAFSWSLTT